MTTPEKHIEQADIYLKYKDKRALTDIEQALFAAAHNCLKDMTNGKIILQTKVWKTECAKLTAEHRMLDNKHVSLKDEEKEAGQIKKSVYSILRKERQPRIAHAVDR